MKELLIGASLLSALVLAPIGVGMQAAPESIANPYGLYSEYIPYYAVEEYVEYEETDEGPWQFLTTARLNLRTGPGTNYDRLLTTNPGQLVYVTDTRDGEWFAVNVNGQTGFMYAEFLIERPDPSDVVVADGSVERLTWSEARQLTTTGTTLTVVDVRTGITWQMASFSNGNHADVEPLTAADTAEMRRAWNGRWCWTPRPVQVHVGGRVLAASLNGMPHAGSTRSGNNMNGHVCMHFYGSRTHNGNRRHETDHQNAVREAYRAGIVTPR